MHGRFCARVGAAGLVVGAALLALGCTPNEAGPDPESGRRSTVLVDGGRPGLEGRRVTGRVQRYVAGVGQEVARHLGVGDRTWEFVVIDSANVDHSAVRLNKSTARVFVTTGLLGVLTNEAQLASALALDIASVSTPAGRDGGSAERDGVDARAIEAIARAGYKAGEYRRFLSAMAEHGVPRSRVPVAVERATPERIERAQRAAEKYSGGTEGVQEYRAGVRGE
ncbi:MAG: M48 family metalloprotease [Phycisphaerae bacterium]